LKRLGGNMTKLNIVGIAPFNGLKISMEKIAEDYPDIHFTAHIGDLMDGVTAAQSFDLSEVDVLVSRGGTALLLKKHTDIPVIEIDVTVYDIMRTLRLAQGLSGKTAIVGFSNITDRAQIINELLDLSINVINISNKETATDILAGLKEKEYEVIICDHVTSAVARKIGLNAILINSVEETIRKAIEQAIEIGKTLLKRKEYNHLLEQITKNSPEKMIVLDGDFNEVKEFTSQSIPNIIKNRIIKIGKRINSHQLPMFKEVYNGKMYWIKKRKIQSLNKTYHVFYINISEIISPSNKSIVLKNISSASEKREELLFNSSLSIGGEYKDIAVFSRYTDPIFIVGESGTGKDKIAELIASYSEQERLWEINCDYLTKSEWSALLNSPDSPLQDENALIYMKEVRSLKKQELDQLLYFAEHTLLFKRNKVVFSTTIQADESTQQLVSLFNDWPIVFYTTSSLRERKGDIPAIASLYINEFNDDYGKQIIGFEPNALERLTNFEWPSNISQFRRVMKQLVIKTEGPYIKDRDTLEQLKEELGVTKSYTNSLIQMDQTLEEISYDVVKMVLKEEKGNKTSTADRLGISRSTLWRLMKKF